MTSSRFCCICGKITDRLIDNRCYSCYIKEKKPEIPKKIEIRVCKRCLRVYSKGKWVVVNDYLPDILASEAINRLSLKGYNIEKYDVLNFMENEGKLTLKVKFKFNFRDIVYETYENIEVKSKFEQCLDCARMAGGYYEGILQIRGKYDEEQVYSVVEKNLQNAFISKIKKHKRGLDFYLSSRKVTKKIAKIFKNKYHAKVIFSPSLVGRSKDGKSLYRITASVRMNFDETSKKVRRRKVGARRKN